MGKSQGEQKEEPGGPEAEKRWSLRGQGERGVQGLEVLPGAGECSQCPPPLFHPSSSPGLVFSSLFPTTEVVALAMSSCSCVPCMYPTLHPFLLRRPYYNKF